MVKVSTSSQITPQRILLTLQAYRDSAALNTAIQLDLFTRIAHGADTVGRIAAELGIPVRGVRLLCEYLTVAGLLEKEDEQLKLTEDVARFLDKKSPAYLGDTAQVLRSPQLLQGFERLTESVRAGKAARPDEPRPTTRPEWIEMARGVADEAEAARAFAAMIEFPMGQPLKILDVGAFDGAYGIALALRYPEAVVVALDCPQALAMAQQNADAARLGTRYQNIPGDPLVSPLGKHYDAALLAGALNQFDEAQITSLFMRIHYALKKNARLVLLEHLSSDSPEFLRDFAGFHLNVLAATPRGGVYGLDDLKGILASSGFKFVDARPVPLARATLVTATP